MRIHPILGGDHKDIQSLKMNFSFQTAFKLNQMIEERIKYHVADIKCHLFYTPQVFLNDLTQQKMRVSIEHRRNLRKTILQTLLNEGIKPSQKQEKAFCDIHHIPTLPNGSISISHCPGLKGFVYNFYDTRQVPSSKKPLLPRDIETAFPYPIHQNISFRRKNSKFEKSPHRIGLDVEVTSRVKTHSVSFLSKKVELDNMPNPACLWTAKEAAFKCLYPTKFQISQITIEYWKAVSKRLYNFYFSTPSRQQGKGYCFIWEQWTIALAVIFKK